MSAYGPKRTYLVAPHMSAFGGKADMADCGSPLSRSLLGVKRTCGFAPHMSASDPKRTYRNVPQSVVAEPFRYPVLGWRRCRLRRFVKDEHECTSLLFTGGGQVHGWAAGHNHKLATCTTNL